MLSDLLNKYIAKKIVEDIRKNSLSPEIAWEVVKYPFNDLIRKELKQSDSIYIKKLLIEKDWRLKSFALMISRPFQDDQEIKEIILNIWNTDAKNSFPIANECIYRLLEYEDVAEEHRHEMFNYIKGHWGEWKDTLPRYIDLNEIFGLVRSRLDDTSFPSWKKWIYLTLIACSPEKDRGKNMLKELKNENGFYQTDPFVKSVIDWLLGELKEK